MSNLTSILSTDLVSNSRSTINDNFNALNLHVVGNSSSIVSLQSSIVAKSTITVSSVAGTILSITTQANDKVIVWVKGLMTGTTNVSSVALVYNGVIKDTIVINQSADLNTNPVAFSLMYAETPGVASASIVASVVSNIGGTTILSGLKILTEIIS